MKGKIFPVFIIAVLVLRILPLSAFDWPQEGVSASSFSTQFGQLRGGAYSNALIFSEQAEVSAIESGSVIAILGDNSSEMGWFHSPLGNAVIIAHEDSLMSVYGNLSQVTVSPETTQIPKGGKLGTSGFSGWQSGQSSLELQVIDTEQESSINPRILMPRFPEEPSLLLHGITAVGRNGEAIELRTRKSLSAGSYKLYRGHDQGFFPYKSRVVVNGAEVETLTFNNLTRSGRWLTVVGRKAYNVKESYPTADKQFLTEVTLAQGKNTISVTIADINGKEYGITYTLEVW